MYQQHGQGQTMYQQQGQGQPTYHTQGQVTVMQIPPSYGDVMASPAYNTQYGVGVTNGGYVASSAQQAPSYQPPGYHQPSGAAPQQ